MSKELIRKANCKVGNDSKPHLSIKSSVSISRCVLDYMYTGIISNYKKLIKLQKIPKYIYWAGTSAESNLHKKTHVLNRISINDSNMDIGYNFF